jgi:SAM-dependent methyltransferase
VESDALVPLRRGCVVCAAWLHGWSVQTAALNPLSTVIANLRPIHRHCRICNLADFRDPDLRKRIREAFPPGRRGGRLALGKRLRFPTGSESREHWETAMTLLAIDRFGIAGDEAEILCIGPRSDALAYSLTLRARWVFATEIDRAEGAWSRTRSGEMILEDPGRQWPGRWNPHRFVYHPMDPLRLQYDDESFSCICSIGAIERLDVDAARTAVDEIFRVLAPGGVASIATAFRLEGSASGGPGPLLLDRRELSDLLLRQELSWAIANQLETSVSEETLRSRLVDRAGDHFWTSVHLILVKPLYH